MAVGVNQPFHWQWERYGQNFGPPFNPNPPGPKEFWRDRAPSLLDKLKELGVKVVRIFILGNAWNYGPDPTEKEVTEFKPLPIPGGGALSQVKRWVFDPPDDEKTLYPFFEHFETMLTAFQRAGGIQVMPSVIDFRAFIEPRGFLGGGARADLIRNPKKRDLFIETMVNGLVAVAGGYREQIYAWDPMNEPVHLVTPISKHVYDDNKLHDPFLPLADVKAFVAAIDKKIREKKYQTSVGHRLLSDLDSFRVYCFGPDCLGTLRQFHYYHVIGPLGIGGDDDELPKFTDSKAILGEFASYPDDPDMRWTGDLKNGQDNDVKDSAYERLRIAAAKGYQLAMAWPGRATDDPDLRYGKAEQACIKRFTHTRFPKGIPPLR